jgi:hypothetical protein
MLEVSTLYQLTTDPGVNSNTATTPTLIPSATLKYFLRLEKKLGKPRDQDSFLAKHGDHFTVLKSFIQLMLITINKTKIIQQ